MGFPNLLKKLFQTDGKGPLLLEEILPTIPAEKLGNVPVATAATTVADGVPGLAVYAADNDIVSRNKAATPAGVAAQIEASAGGTSAPTANTTMKRDSAGRAQVAAPSANDDITNKSYVDSAVSGASSAASAKAPKPQAAAGVGQWLALKSTILPSGGTWAYVATVIVTTGTGNGATRHPEWAASVAAGGTRVNGDSRLGFCWRIA